MDRQFGSPLFRRMNLSSHLLGQVKRTRDNSTRDKDAETADKLEARLFREQRDFALDVASFVAALCPRRAGKSFAVLVKALITALRNPESRCVIITRVRRQARSVYWKTLQQLCRQFEIKGTFRKIEMECELPNGSVILFNGADTAEEVDKLRGSYFHLAVIDECKSYSDDLLTELVDEVLTATTLDYDGQVVLIGTPGPIPAGMFWAITTGQTSFRDANGKERGLSVRLWSERNSPDWLGRGYEWALHKWHSSQNDRMPQIWIKAQKIKADRKWADDDPTWLREFMGVWVPDVDALVFAYARLTDDRCKWKMLTVEQGGNEHGLPRDHDWRYILGLDLGYHDESAFVVAAWSETDNILRYIRAEKHPHLTVEDIAEKCKELEVMYGGFDARVADTGGLGRTIIESLAATYQVYFEAARKTEKHDHIKLLNSDMVAGRVQVDPMGELAAEWVVAQWEDSTRKRVDPNCSDHASDAALYVWRYCHHHWSQDRTHGPDERGTERWWKEVEVAEERAFIEQKQKDRDNPRWTRFQARLDKTDTVERLWTTRISTNFRRSLPR